MLEEFKKFALRGNVVDLAIGVIIGAAFGGIVNSMVSDIIMPMVGAATGGLDFSNYFVPLSSKVTADSLVDLVEHERRHRIVSRQHDLQGEHDAGQLAARGNPRQRTGIHSLVDLHEEDHRFRAVGFRLGQGHEVDGHPPPR